jgi:predicted lipoprotein with Yx(FWY)xxD motif
MKREIRTLFVPGVVMLTSIITVMSCKKSDYNNGYQTPPQQQKLVSLQSSTTLGNHLVDKDNRSLYFFSNDANGQDNCTGGCQVNWQAFSVDNLTASDIGTDLNFSDFSSITSATGKKQVTYKGWPLYQYSPTGNNVLEAPGQTLGDGVANLWFAAKPDYSIMTANAQLVGTDGNNYKSDYTVGDGKTIYFTDDRGLTLYTFSHDSLNKNKFTKADLSNNALWPVYETDKVVVPSNIDKTKFGSINVFGKTQLTYNGWPLYYFGQDAKTRGSNKGISFLSPGLWRVPVNNISPAP